MHSLFFFAKALTNTGLGHPQDSRGPPLMEAPTPRPAASRLRTAFVYYGKRTTTHGKRREKGVMHVDGSLRAIIPFNALTSYKYARIIE